MCRGQTISVNGREHRLVLQLYQSSWNENSAHEPETTSMKIQQYCGLLNLNATLKTCTES